MIRALRPDRRAGLLLAASLLLLVGGAAVTVVLPAADPSAARTSSPRQWTPAAERGRRIYRAEGCWYCHTQQVRPLAADDGLGPPLAPGDYAHDQPAMLGSERVGPDLTHVGSRYQDPAQLVAFLRRPHGPMPSYGYLSRRELESLAAYLLALR